MNFKSYFNKNHLFLNLLIFLFIIFVFTNYMHNTFEKHEEEKNLIEQGEIHLEEGLIEEAMKAFKTAAEKDQTNPLAHSGIISCYLKMSNVTEAKVYLENLNDEMRKKAEILKMVAYLL